MPAVPVLRHQTRGPGPRRHVDIVSAGVRPRNRLAARVFHDDFTGERQIGFFLDGQGIQFGPQHHRRPRPIFHYRDNASLPDASSDLISQGPRARGKFGRRLHLLERQLRVLVQVDIQGFDVRIDGINFGRGRRRPCGLAFRASSPGEQSEK